MEGSTRRDEVGAFHLHLVSQCQRGDPPGRDVVARDRWLRLLNRRGYGGEVMGSEGLLDCLGERCSRLSGDRQGMAWVVRDRWLRLLNLLGCGGEVMGSEG